MQWAVKSGSPWNHKESDITEPLNNNNNREGRGVSDEVSPVGWTHQAHIIQRAREGRTLHLLISPMCRGVCHLLNGDSEFGSWAQA